MQLKDKQTTQMQIKSVPLFFSYMSKIWSNKFLGKHFVMKTSDKK